MDFMSIVMSLSLDLYWGVSWIIISTIMLLSLTYVLKERHCGFYSMAITHVELSLNTVWNEKCHFRFFLWHGKLAETSLKNHWPLSRILLPILLSENAPTSGSLTYDVTECHCDVSAYQNASLRYVTNLNLWNSRWIITP